LVNFFPEMVKLLTWIPTARSQLRKHVPTGNNRRTSSQGHARNTRTQQLRRLFFPCLRWRHAAVDGGHVTCVSCEACPFLGYISDRIRSRQLYEWVVAAEAREQNELELGAQTN
jgi:hypothetical protein